MHNRSRFTRATALMVAAASIALALTGAAVASSRSPQYQRGTKPTIVLVHGAWADGSSWAAVTSRLQREGFTVDVAPNALRGVTADSEYLAAYLSTITGPIILVGHSYGGMVITDAATGNANVKALVYVDAFIPDLGETVNHLTQAQPGSALAVPPQTVFNFVPIPNGGGNVDLYVKPELFPAIFAAGVPSAKAAVLAAGQRPIAASALDEKSTAPAWKSIPSWAIVGTADRVIPPAEQLFMATRAGAHIKKLNAPHLSMVADPFAVSELIVVAASHI
jgi:pimeloyl-ACP methyl ester carboxylesterase